MKRVNDPSAGVVGRIFLSLLGIKTPKEISYKSGVGVVFELKKEDGSSVLLCLPKKDFYAGLLFEIENKFYSAFDCKRFTITMEDIHWLSADDIFGRTIHDGNIWGVPATGGNSTVAIAVTIGLTESEAKSRRYDRRCAPIPPCRRSGSACTTTPSPRWTGRSRWRSASAASEE